MHHNGSHIYPRSRPSWCAWPVGRQTRMSFSSRDSLLLAAPFSQHGSWVLSTLKPGCSLPRPLGKRSIHSVMERVRKGPQRSPGLASLLKQDGRRAHGTDCIQVVPEHLHWKRFHTLCAAYSTVWSLHSKVPTWDFLCSTFCPFVLLLGTTE